MPNFWVWWVPLFKVLRTKKRQAKEIHKHHKPHGCSICRMRLSTAKTGCTILTQAMWFQGFQRAACGSARPPAALRCHWGWLQEYASRLGRWVARPKHPSNLAGCHQSWHFASTKPRHLLGPRSGKDSDLQTHGSCCGLGYKPLRRNRERTKTQPAPWDRWRSRQ